ncbi:MAG: zinc metalloprotease HtpX [Nitrospiria bacterium]
MNYLKTTILMTLMTVLLVFVGQALGGQSGAIFAFVLAMTMNGFSYWYSDKIVLKMYRAQPVTEYEAPEIYRLVRELTQRAGMPMPKVYLIDNPTPNAFATGRDPDHAAVAVTTGIVQRLNEEELRGVLAHELSHVKHRDILISTVAATIAGAISMLANMAQWAMIFGGFGRSSHNDEKGGAFGAILMMMVAPIAAMLIQMAISRSREFAADAGAAKMTENPLGLASALRKLQEGNRRIPMQANPATAHMFIVSPLSGRGVASLFSTHPAMEERIRRLESMADGRG